MAKSFPRAMVGAFFDEDRPRRRRIPEDDRKKVMVRQKEKCALCDKKLAYGEAHFDHKRASRLAAAMA